MHNLRFSSPTIGMSRTNASACFPSLCAGLAGASGTIPALFQVGVLSAIRMPFRAMGFAGILIGTKKILTSRHWFHVAWIDTCRYATQMVNVQALWNLTTCQFIGHTVHKEFTFDTKGVVDSHDTIAMIAHMPSPKKTWAKGWSDLWDWSSLAPVRKSLGKRLGANPVLPIPQVRGHLNTSRFCAWNTV